MLATRAGSRPTSGSASSSSACRSLVIGLVVSYPVALLAFAVVGFGNSIADIAALTLFQRIVPDHVLGRRARGARGLLLGAIGVGGLSLRSASHSSARSRALIAAGRRSSPSATLLRRAVSRSIDRTQKKKKKIVAPAHTALLSGDPAARRPAASRRSSPSPRPRRAVGAASARRSSARARGRPLLRDRERRGRVPGARSAPASRSGRSRSSATSRARRP